MIDDGSDYIVEEFIKPNKVRKRIINDERGDLLGNFDDSTLKKKPKTKMKFEMEENPFADNDDDDSDPDDDDGPRDDTEKSGNDEDLPGTSEEYTNGFNVTDENVVSSSPEANDSEENSDNESGTNSQQQTISSNNKKEKLITANTQLETEHEKKDMKKKKKKSKTNNDPSIDPTGNKLNDEQIQALLRGACKQNRYVLYVTNLNYETTRDKLSELFTAAGTVKSVRIPKNRKTAFAFVEMDDINGFKNALGLHNKSLDNYKIKIQVSEGGKKKSANKKNILKQKNRKLAEMRNEGKQFSKSGKGYNKTLKKEIRQQQFQRNRKIAKNMKSKIKP